MDKPKWEHVWDSMVKLTDKVAQSPVHKAILEHLPSGSLTLVPGNINQFRKIRRLNLLNSYNTQAKLTSFVAKKEFNQVVMEEIMFRIGKHIFGTNMIGRNAYYCLKHLMCDYNMNPSYRICKCASLMSQLNDYITYMPNQAFDKK